MISMKVSSTPESSVEQVLRKETPKKATRNREVVGSVERISAVVPTVVLELLRNYVAQKTEEGTDLTLTDVYVEALKDYLKKYNITIDNTKPRSGELKRGRRKGDTDDKERAEATTNPQDDLVAKFIREQEELAAQMDKEINKVEEGKAEEGTEEEAKEGTKTNQGELVEV